MVTVHMKQPSDAIHPVKLLLDQHMIEPMGYSRSTPIADHADVTDAGIWLTFNVRAEQNNALIRFDLSPTALGLVAMEISDGADTVHWSMLVVP